MKFLHLSDLHLGKNVNGYSMIEDQKYILKEVLDIIDKSSLDAVVIAGDVYDKSIATLEAIKLFDEFMADLASRKLKVYMISGNHDSAIRLATNSELIKNAGIYVSKEYDGSIQKVCEKDSYGEINFYLLPFIKPIQVRNIHNIEEQISYSKAVEIAVENMKIDKSKRNVILVHQFVSGAETAGSEEIINVGGIDNVDKNIFKDFDYVALGHIHRAQDVVKGQMRYPGTLLKYSFNEVNNEKSVTIVEIKEKGNVNIETVEIHPQIDWMEIHGKYNDLVSKAYYDKIKKDSYMKIVLEDEEDVVDAFSKLSIIYPRIMNLNYDNKRTRENSQIDKALEIESKSPIELIEEFYKEQNNKEMSSEQLALTKKLVEKIWEAEE